MVYKLFGLVHIESLNPKFYSSSIKELNVKFGEDVKPSDSLRKSGNKILNAYSAGNIVVATADCYIEYKGNAESQLPESQRIIILKPDSSLQVHTGEGIQPINWQKPNSDIKIRVHDDALHIISTTKNSELRIECYDIKKSIHFKPPDSDEKSISGTEEDMHKEILENPDIIEEGLKNIEHEKRIRTGSIDIYAIDSTGLPVVIEVKRKKAQQIHVDQLKRYVETLREKNEQVRGILTAPSISKQAKEHLENQGFEFCQMNPIQT